MDVRIRMLLKIIEERGGVLRMSSEQVGSLLGLGEARILRLFSKEVGKPLRRHLLEVKMARAAEWLKGGVLPIKTIAFNCGYSAVSNFYRDFKSVYRTSPMQMRLMQMSYQLHDENWGIDRAASIWPVASLDVDRAGSLHRIAPNLQVIGSTPNRRSSPKFGRPRSAPSLQISA